MSVPKRLKALSTDLLVRSRIHQDHYEEHEVSGNATRLSVMDIESLLFPDLCTKEMLAYQSGNLRRSLTGSLNIKEVHVVGCRMYHGPERHRIGNLTMEPNILVCGEQP